MTVGVSTTPGKTTTWLGIVQLAVTGDAVSATEPVPTADCEGIVQSAVTGLAVSVMLPTFMEVLDTAIASVALPYIAGSLSASNSEATWVLTSYLVANAVILPAANWFARRFGRKNFLFDRLLGRIDRGCGDGRCCG